MLSGIKLSIIMMSVIMMSVIWLGVMARQKERKRAIENFQNKTKTFFRKMKSCKFFFK
jgi:hypothetical protein